MTVTCPNCAGFGKSAVIGRGWPSANTMCRTCDGTGTISADLAARLETGRALRRDRIARGVSLGEEAARLGIGKRELADREWGRAEGEIRRAAE